MILESLDTSNSRESKLKINILIIIPMAINQYLSKVILALTLPCLALSCTNQAQQQSEQEYIEDTTAMVEEVTSEEEQEQAIIDGMTKWFYSKTEDDLTHDITSITATILSTNECRYDSYGHTARMVMTLTYSTMYLSTPSTAVLLSFDDGKTDMCKYAEDFSSGFRVVFDNGNVDDRWTLIDNTPKRNVIFMYMPSKVKPFLAMLRSSKTCRIQVNLENVGKTTFDFNIEGLKWDFDKDNSRTVAPAEDASVEDSAPAE